MSESKKPSASSSDTQKAASKNEKNKNQETQIVDPELDLKSAHFNPLKALYASSVHVPVDNVPTYNNIAHYESTMRMRQQQHTSGDGSVSKSREKKLNFLYQKFHSKQFNKNSLFDLFVCFHSVQCSCFVYSQ